MGSRSRALAAALLWAAASLWTACTDSSLENRPSVLTNADDRLTIRGTACSKPPDITGFPVKVVLLIDKSGSMCISDPPGAQEQPGLCERLQGIPGVIPPGTTEPARVRALRKLLQQFQQSPNVSVAIVPFETNVKNKWPDSDRFGRPADVPDSYITGLQADLGKGTDYQGALSYAYGLVLDDIRKTNGDDPTALSQANPEELPRTRYVVVFLTDGTPYPRCAANDNLTGCGPGALDCYADPYHPEKIWADSASAGDFCNLTDPLSTDNINGFEPGTDRNQNYQIFSYVDRLMELKQQYNIGDIRFHTVLLFNQAAVQACGSICTDIYGVYPSVAQSDYPAAAKMIATWTLQRMAERGNGVYQEFVNSDIQGLGLGALDYSSMYSPNVLKTLIVQSLTSTPQGGQHVVDSDGDGLPDELDTSVSVGTNQFIPDTDGDCLSDGFEYSRKDQGFIAKNDKDIRGCDPLSPLSLGCTCTDTDGDGLSFYEEQYLKTKTGIIDSDGDGIPDGMEARYRLDPLTPNTASLDTDGDGIPDRDEFLAGTNPTEPDRALFDRDGYQYEIHELPPEPDGSTCYDFTVSNVKLVTPPSRAGVQQGYNLFKVWFATAPRSGVATDFGEWTAACVWAQYDPPRVRVPATPDIALSRNNFLPPTRISRQADYIAKDRAGNPVYCVGTPP